MLDQRLPVVFGEVMLGSWPFTCATARGINKGGGRGFFGDTDFLVSSFLRGNLSVGTELDDSPFWAVALVLSCTSFVDTVTEQLSTELDASGFLDESREEVADCEPTLLLDSDFPAELFSGADLFGSTLPFRGMVKESFGLSDGGTKGVGVLGVAVDLVTVDVEFGEFLKKMPDLETGVPRSEKKNSATETKYHIDRYKLNMAAAN